MHTSLLEAVGLLNKWAVERSPLIGSLGTGAVSVVFCGSIKPSDNAAFVISQPSGIVSPSIVTIWPDQAIGFEYDDNRKVPEQLRNQVSDIVSGLVITFPTSSLAIYEIKSSGQPDL